MFALRFKESGQLASMATYSEESGPCAGVIQFYLSNYQDNVAVFMSREQAEYVANNSNSPMNSTWDFPENFYAGQLEVVELVVK